MLPIEKLKLKHKITKTKIKLKKNIKSNKMHQKTTNNKIEI